MKGKKIYFALIMMIIFLINTFLVISGKTAGLDDAVHTFIRSFESGTTDTLMHIFTFFGSVKWCIILTGVVCVTLFFTKKRMQAYLTFAAIAISTILNNVVKYIIRRERPSYITVVEHSFSYPSGHTMGATAIYGFIIYLILRSNLNKGLKAVLTVMLSLIICLVMISRIYLGAHYFSDVFGGLVFSIFVLIILAIVIDEKKLLD